MVLTEEDAQKNWCPFVRAVGGGYETARNCEPKSERTPSYARCVSSSCMAWRWTKQRLSAPDDPNATGYCGLAGKPTE